MTSQADLQKKIFTRWVNLKIQKSGLQIKDIVTDVKDGEPLVRLLEVLSEKSYPKKTKFGAKARAIQMNNASEALNWMMTNTDRFVNAIHPRHRKTTCVFIVVVKDCKIEMKGVQPSAENLVDGEFNAILGLVWAIMLKYLKLEEDDGGPVLNFKDSLLMWLKNQISSYPDIHVKDLTKSWHDGLALCALIHKFRPKLMPNFEDLKSEDGRSTLKTRSHAENTKCPKNLDLAFKAANKYFGLEEYVTTGDILKMDEKCMTVYLSEYYYGVAQARKVDLAARRITKLIAFTKINDGLRKEFTEKSTQVVELFKKVFAVLDDTTIDNTMEGRLI